MSICEYTCMCEHACCIFMFVGVWVCVCVLKKGILGSSLSKINQDVLERICFHFFSSNAFEEVRVKLQTLLSGADLG